MSGPRAPQPPHGPQQALAEREALLTATVVPLLRPGETLVALVLCTRGVLGDRVDRSAFVAGFFRPRNLLAGVLFDNGGPEPEEYRTPIPGSGGPAGAVGAAGPALEAALPGDAIGVLAVTAHRLVVFAPRPQPAPSLPDRLRGTGRSLVRGVRDLVLNPVPVAPVPQLAERWSCGLDAVVAARAQAPGRAGAPCVRIDFRDASWCTVSPGFAGLVDHSQRLLTALDAGRRYPPPPTT